MSYFGPNAEHLGIHVDQASKVSFIPHLDLKFGFNIHFIEVQTKRSPLNTFLTI